MYACTHVCTLGWYVCICMCTYVCGMCMWHVCMYTYVCTCMYIHVCVCVLPHPSFRFLRQVISLNLELIASARLNDQQSPGIGLSLSPQHWGDRYTPPYQVVWRSNFSSCLYRERFTPEPSPTPRDLLLWSSSSISLRMAQAVDPSVPPLSHATPHRSESPSQLMEPRTS